MAKKGGNPQNFIKCSEEMAEKPLSVRVSVELDQYVRSLPNRTEWLRAAIREKKQREDALQQASVF
jgi:hypothetical protein